MPGEELVICVKRRKRELLSESQAEIDGHQKFSKREKKIVKRANQTWSGTAVDYFFSIFPVFYVRIDFSDFIQLNPFDTYTFFPFSFKLNVGKVFCLNIQA